MLKAIRNLAADSAANVVYHVPTTEPVFRAVGRMLDPIPHVRTLYRRGIDTLLKQLVASRQQYRSLDLGDVSFLFDASDFTAHPRIFYGRLFEPETTQFLLTTLQPGQMVFDVGANRGYITLIAASRVGSAGRVHSFEPNPKVMSELKQHVEMNGVKDRVVLSSEALSDQSDGEAVFYVSTLETNSGLSSLTPADELLQQQALSPDHTIRVRTTTLDDYVQASGLSRPIDLIKVDVEGAEMQVLKGAQRLLQTCPPKCWIVETEPGSKACHLLRGLGYSEQHFDPAGDKVNAVFMRD